MNKNRTISIDAFYFGEELHELRKAKGWNQQQFASKIGISERSIRDYENGLSFPRQEVLHKIYLVLSK